MFCMECGKRLKKDDMVCAKCGAVVETVKDSEEVSSQKSSMFTNKSGEISVPVNEVDISGNSQTKTAFAPIREVSSGITISKARKALIVALIFVVALSGSYFIVQKVISHNTDQVKQANNMKKQIPESMLRLQEVLKQTRKLAERSTHAKVPGDPLKTAANYRAIEQEVREMKGRVPTGQQLEAEAELGQMIGEVLVGLEESSGILADYHEGRRSLVPPNPDWVDVANTTFEKAWRKMESAEIAYKDLRSRYDQ